MAIFQLQAKDEVCSINQFDALNCVQNFNWDVAMNAQNLSQLGDQNYTAQTITPEVTGSFEVYDSGVIASFLNRMIYSLDAGTQEFMGYRGISNATLIRETDLERAVFDFIDKKKANEVFDRAKVMMRCHLATIAMSLKADGESSETYTFQADQTEIFRNSFRDFVSIPCTRTVATPDSSVDVPAPFTVEAAVVDPTADYHIYALDIDGDRVMAADLVATSGTPYTVALSAAKIAAGVTIPLGSKTSLMAYKKTPGAFPTITFPTSARFVKGDKIDIFLVDPTSTFTVSGATDTVPNLLTAGKDFNLVPFLQSDLLLRVQSLDLNIDLRREALKEIRRNDRGNSIFYRAATFPLQCTGQMSVFETDLNTWAKLQHKNAYGSATPDILNLADFENQEWMLIARYYKGTTVLQTVGFLNARVDNPGTKGAVNSRATESWNWTASQIAIQGVDGV